MKDNRGIYLSYFGDVMVVDQYSFSFGVLPTKVFSNPGDQLVPVKAHLEDIFRDGIESVFFLLSREVRVGNQENGKRHTDEALWNTSSSDS